MHKGLHSFADIATLKTMLKSPNSVSSSLPYLYTINAQVYEHNLLAYTIAETSKKCTISAIETVSGDVTEDIKQKILSKTDDPSKTIGLFKYLLFVEDMPAEICIKIDVGDCLTNKTTCLVKTLDFRVENSQRCSIIWVEFENKAVGSKARTKYAHLFAPYCSKSWTPVLEIARNFNVGMFEMEQYYANIKPDVKYTYVQTSGFKIQEFLQSLHRKKEHVSLHKYWSS